eukprot:PhF_6_TR37440/c0_g1_i2/m.55009
MLVSQTLGESSNQDANRSHSIEEDENKSDDDDDIDGEYGEFQRAQLSRRLQMMEDENNSLTQKLFLVEGELKVVKTKLAQYEAVLQGNNGMNVNQTDHGQLMAQTLIADMKLNRTEERARGLMTRVRVISGRLLADLQMFRERITLVKSETTRNFQKMSGELKESLEAVAMHVGMYIADPRQYNTVSRRKSFSDSGVTSQQGSPTTYTTQQPSDPLGVTIKQIMNQIGELAQLSNVHWYTLPLHVNRVVIPPTPLTAPESSFDTKMNLIQCNVSLSNVLSRQRHYLTVTRAACTASYLPCYEIDSNNLIEKVERKLSTRCVDLLECMYIHVRMERKGCRDVLSQIDLIRSQKFGGGDKLGASAILQSSKSEEWLLIDAKIEELQEVCKVFWKLMFRLFANRVGLRRVLVRKHSEGYNSNHHNNVVNLLEDKKMHVVGTCTRCCV